MARTWLSPAAEALSLGIPAFLVALALLALAGILNYSRQSALPRLRRFSPLRPYGLLIAVLLPATAACGLQGFNPTASRDSLPARAAVGTAQTPSANGPQGASVTAPAELRALQDEFVSVVKTVGPSVVQIETREGLGSGIIFDSQGDIVTNAHVVGSSQQFNVTLASGRQYSGRLVGTFTADDLAVVRIDGGPFPAASFADSSTLQVGDIVMAIGNPLGLQSSVTEGIVSAVGRTLSEQNGATLNDLIQTSAAINPGNSGGALVDLQGQVVGIPTLGASSQGGAAAGIGFAIPSNTVKDIAGQLVQSGRVTNSHRPYLGVQLAGTQGGVLITAIVPGGPAEKAGLSAGDLITAAAGRPTATSQDLSAALAGLRPGENVSLAIRHRSGATSTVRVTLGQFPG